MANSKISDLTELTSAADADVLAIVDDSATETKKITFANLASSITVGSTTELQFTGTNITGTAIAKGKAVYISGAQGNDTTIALADNSAAATMPAFGITKEEIANNASGVVVLAGTLASINTVAYSEGDELYVSTSGDLTDTKPTGTALIQKIAKVAKAAASGSLIVTGAGRTNDLPNLANDYLWVGDANGVPAQVEGPNANGELLIGGTSGLSAATLTAGSGVTITNGDGSITITATGTGGISAVVDDTTPQLGGNLDVQGFEINTATTNGNITLDPNGTGFVELKGNQDAGGTNPGTIRFNCELNSHGVTVKGPAHSAAATYTLTLPTADGTTNQPMVTDGSGQLSFSDTIVVDGFTANDTGQGSIQASGNGLLDGTLKLTASATAPYALAICDSTDTLKMTLNPTGLVNAVQVYGSSWVHGSEIRVGGSLNFPEYTLTDTDGTAGRPLSTDGAGDVSFNSSITCDVTGDLTGNVDGTELEVVTQTTAVDAAGEAEGTIVKFGTGTLVAGQVYTHASGAWVAVDADAQTTTEGLLGMALGTSPTTNGLLVHGVGYLSHDPGTAGDVLYVSATAGQVTGTQPSTTGQFVRVAGYCLANNKVFFSPSQDFIEIG